MIKSWFASTSLVQRLGLLAGLAVFAWIAGADSSLHHDPTYGSRPALAAAAVALMAIWWLTEALPIYATACVPIVLFPLLGLFGPGVGSNLRQTLLPYVDPYIFLFAGGMGIAAAMQQWNLHRRIALTIMAAIGSDPRRVLAGSLIATAFISMWISNTATAAMMMPIGMAVIVQMEAQRGGVRLPFFGMAIMLSIAYGANVGGIGTKIGTAPNAQFAGFAENLGIEVSFLQFLLVGSPFVIMFLPIVWAMLWRIARRDGLEGASAGEVVKAELARLGPMQRAEGVVLAVFAVTAALWIAGKPLTSLVQSTAAQLTTYKIGSSHVEGGIAVIAALLLMAWRVHGRLPSDEKADDLPSKDGPDASERIHERADDLAFEDGRSVSERSEFAEAARRKPGRPRATTQATRQQVLTLAALRKVPWETLLLLGGGFAMAAGTQRSGLSDWAAHQLAALSSLPPYSQVLAAAVATIAISAVASNTATIAVMLVVLKDVVTIPELLPTVLFTATIAASCDFALPAGTPPNAIVFGSGYVTIPRMARTGVVLDLLAALLAASWCYWVVPLVLGP